MVLLYNCVEHKHAPSTSRERVAVNFFIKEDKTDPPNHTRITLEDGRKGAW